MAFAFLCDSSDAHHYITRHRVRVICINWKASYCRAAGKEYLTLH